jgi:hypothetical protein
MGWNAFPRGNLFCSAFFSKLNERSENIMLRAHVLSLFRGADQFKIVFSFISFFGKYKVLITRTF